MSAAPRDKLGKRILWGVILGVLIYAGIAIFSDFGALVADLRTFPVSVFAAALGLSVVNYSIRWVKWEYFLRRLEIRIPVADSVIIFVAGLTMSITPGKVGEVLKSVLLKQSHDVSVATSAPIVIAERLADMFGLFVIAAFGIGVFDYGRVVFFAMIATLVTGMLVVQSSWAVGRLLDVVERLPWLGRLRPRLEEAHASMQELLRWHPLFVATALSVASWSMEAFAFYLILDGLGAQRLEVNLAAFVYAMTTLLGAVSFLPGGLGVTEGSMIGALLLFHVFKSEATATAATYLVRFATLWFAVGLGVVGLGFFRRRAAGPTQDVPPG